VSEDAITLIGELAPLLSALGHEKHKAPQIRVVLLSPYLDAVLLCGYALVSRSNYQILLSPLIPLTFQAIDFALLCAFDSS